jgi:hypothetical protein
MRQNAIHEHPIRRRGARNAVRLIDNRVLELRRAASAR